MPDGRTQRDHLASHSRGRKRIEAASKLPDELRYVWDMFTRLSRRRAYGFGPNPISYNDVHALAQLERIELNGWEIEAIELLDDLWLSTRN